MGILPTAIDSNALQCLTFVVQILLVSCLAIICAHPHPPGAIEVLQTAPTELLDLAVSRLIILT